MTRRNPGQFKPGQSGNPAGRPKGITDWRVRLRKELEASAPALIQSAVEQALAGDTAALRLCLERVLPALRPEAAPVKVPVPDGAGAVEQSRGVVEAMLSGNLPGRDAGELIGAIMQVERVKELTELAERLERIEAKLEESGR